MNTSYTFNISLSVLNHLGRNLYRSFITILGEAISNAWDADAKRVSITIDRDKSLLIIRDDGIGMTSKDFQDKFLRIGYSKRQSGDSKTPNGRPFIGRKGIGKLALLSCAKKISVITKACGSDWVGGVIDNSSLDKAISDDILSSGYKLGVPLPLYSQSIHLLLERRILAQSSYLKTLMRVFGIKLNIFASRSLCPSGFRCLIQAFA